MGEGVLKNLVPHASSPLKMKIETLVTPNAEEDLLSVSQTVDMSTVKGMWLGNDESNKKNDSKMFMTDGNTVPIERNAGSYYVRFKVVEGDLPNVPTTSTSRVVPADDRDHRARLAPTVTIGL